MNSQQQQEHIPIQETAEPSEEGQQLVTLFTEMEHKQLDFLDESGKSLIERIATFLAILFGVTVLSNNFPPPYLKGNPSAKILVFVTLAFYIAAMAAGVWAIQPRSYRYYLHNRAKLRGELERITRHKLFWGRVGGVLFLLGSAALAILIIAIVWTV